MERLLYLFTGGDIDLIIKLQEEFEKTGKTTIPDDVQKKVRLI